MLLLSCGLCSIPSLADESPNSSGIVLASAPFHKGESGCLACRSRFSNSSCKMFLGSALSLPGKPLGLATLLVCQHPVQLNPSYKKGMLGNLIVHMALKACSLSGH